MADQTIFNVTISLEQASDVSIDFSAGQSYSGFSGNSPWSIILQVDGVTNNGRGGAGAISDVVSCMGAAGNLSAGLHNVKVIWSADTNIQLRGAVLRVLRTTR